MKRVFHTIILYFWNLAPGRCRRKYVEANLKKQLFLALFAIAIVGVAIYLFQPLKTGDNTDTPVVTTTNNNRSSRSAVDVPGSPNSSVKSGSNNRLSSSGSTDVSQPWKQAISSSQTAWFIKQWSISASPDDWYRAYAFSNLCIGATATSPTQLDAVLAASRAPDNHRAAIKKLHQEAHERCLQDGEQNGAALIGAEILRGLVPRAKEAGSPLANAPRLTAKVLEKGMTQSEEAALKNVMISPDLRSSWITVNAIDFGEAIKANPAFSGLDGRASQAVLFQAMCRSGDDCGPGSLYQIALCQNTGYSLCGAAGIDKTLAAAFDSEQVQRIAYLADQLRSTMDKGDLRLLGLTK